MSVPNCASLKLNVAHTLQEQQSSEFCYNDVTRDILHDEIIDGVQPQSSIAKCVCVTQRARHKSHCTNRIHMGNTSMRRTYRVIDMHVAHQKRLRICNMKQTKPCRRNICNVHILHNNSGTLSKMKYRCISSRNVLYLTVCQ
mmetsp:Transcript_2332/g.8716  ORF Transcript_2332/g.8716 Transcript_2332/m.8716 type:complete len:142 (-) Transcript_2332:6181-6606(-)